MSNCTICRIMGSNIRLQRVACGYTQEYVASEAGITQGALSKVEKGESELRVEAALRIARLLHRTVDELASPRMVIQTPQQKIRKTG